MPDPPSLLLTTIQRCGLTVRTYPSAQEFLHTYQASDPGCLVLDIRMPGMSGRNLQAELASRQNCLPILIITGYAEVPLVIRAMKAGAFDFIEKPFSAGQRFSTAFMRPWPRMRSPAAAERHGKTGR